MKKKRITYGVYGMMEYQALIKIGKATLKVQFTDGSITAYGQNPAQFTTADFIVQHAIENSSDYKRGRIKRVNVIELDEDVHIERNPVQGTAQEATATAATGTAEVSETADAPAEATADGDKVEAASSEASAESSTSTMTEVEFTCNADAKEYLENTFGVKASLRTRADIIACGETYGVKISFAE